MKKIKLIFKLVIDNNISNSGKIIQNSSRNTLSRFESKWDSTQNLNRELAPQNKEKLKVDNDVIKDLYWKIDYLTNELKETRKEFSRSLKRPSTKEDKFSSIKNKNPIDDKDKKSLNWTKPQLADSLFNEWNTSQHKSFNIDKSLNKSWSAIIKEDKSNTSLAMKKEIENFRKSYTRGRYNQLEKKRSNSSKNEKDNYQINNSIDQLNFRKYEPHYFDNKENIIQVTNRTTNRLPYNPISNYDLMWDQRNIPRITAQYRSIRLDYSKYNSPHYWCRLYEHISH